VLVLTIYEIEIQRSQPQDARPGREEEKNETRKGRQVGDEEHRRWIFSWLLSLSYFSPPLILGFWRRSSVDVRDVCKPRATHRRWVIMKPWIARRESIGHLARRIIGVLLLRVS
jgi:hypothetical protein